MRGRHLRVNTIADGGREEAPGRRGYYMHANRLGHGFEKADVAVPSMTQKLP